MLDFFIADFIQNMSSFAFGWVSNHAAATSLLQGLFAPETTPFNDMLTSRLYLPPCLGEMAKGGLAEDLYSSFNIDFLPG